MKKEWVNGSWILIMLVGFTGKERMICTLSRKKKTDHNSVILLFSDKLVTLTTHNNERARIVGITTDYGMLEAVSVDDPRKKFTLQPDGNSFDMLKGLIIKKL